MAHYVMPTIDPNSPEEINLQEKKLIKVTAFFRRAIFPKDGELGVEADGYGVTLWDAEELKGGVGNYSTDEGIILSLNDGMTSFTVVGYFPFTPLKGVLYVLVLKEVTNKDYGVQYKLVYLNEVTNFADKTYLKRFLMSFLTEEQAIGIIKEIPNCEDVLERGDERALQKVFNIGPVRAKSIIEKYKDRKDASEVYVILQDCGVTNNLIKKLLNTYKSASTVVEVLKRDPYQLCRDVQGIGFKKADDVALKLGMPEKDNRRIAAFIVYLLETYAEAGDSYMYSQEMIQEIYNGFGGKENILEPVLDAEGNIISNNIKQSMDMLLKENVITIEENENPHLRRIYLTYYYNLENKIAYYLNRLLKAPNNFKYEDWQKRIEEKEQEQGWKFTQEQLNGIKLTLDNQVCLIAGSAGTGKSSLVSGVLQALKNYSFAQTSLSGKAAARLQEITGSQGSTIHRLLRYAKGSFYYDETNPLPQDIIILDEISLIGGEIFVSLLKAIKPGSKLIILGDLGQLESVGSLCIARDLHDSPVIPTVELKIIHRQAKKSGIISAATDVRNQKPLFSTDFEGNMVTGDLMDMRFIIFPDHNILAQKVMDIYAEYYNGPIVNRNVMDIHVLTSTRERGDTSAFWLNNVIQQAINPPSLYKKEYKYSITKDKEIIYREHDKIMCFKNTYGIDIFFDNYEYTGTMTDIFNGWTGTIEKITEDGMYMHFPLCETTFENALVYMDIETIRNTIGLSYASTTHKMQGSSAKVIICALDYRTPPIMRTKELLYTMLTRAEKECILVGENGAVQACIFNSFVSTKRTFLPELLLANQQKILEKESTVKVKEEEEINGEAEEKFEENSEEDQSEFF